MKIIRAWVDDPTEVGEVESPQMFVQVDEYPDETHEVLRWDDGWQMSKYGPFVSYAKLPVNSVGLVLCEEVDAGDYNIRFAGAHPAIIDIILMVEDKPADETFGLPIPRARQLVRKHCPQWRIYLSDKDAIDGSMLWLPQRIHPLCRHWHPAARMTCDAPAVASVRKSSIDFPLCPQHLEEHNRQRAEARRASTSK